MGFAAGMHPEWRGYNKMQINYPFPKQGPGGLTETENAIASNTASTLFRLRYEYVPTLTITALHERIRPLHVHHFGLERDPEYLRARSLPDQSVSGRFKPVGFGRQLGTQHAQFAPAQNPPVHKYDVALNAPGHYSTRAM